MLELFCIGYTIHGRYVYHDYNILGFKFSKVNEFSESIQASKYYFTKVINSLDKMKNQVYTGDTEQVEVIDSKWDLDVII